MIHLTMSSESQIKHVILDSNSWPFTQWLSGCKCGIRIRVNCYSGKVAGHNRLGPRPSFLPDHFCHEALAHQQPAPISVREFVCGSSLPQARTAEAFKDGVRLDWSRGALLMRPDNTT